MQWCHQQFSKTGNFVGQRMIRSGGLVWHVTRILFKKEGLEPQVKKFYKYIKIWRHGEQIRATQTYHRRGLGDPPQGTQRLLGCGGKAPSHWAISCNFLEKIVILMPFGSHFAYFQSHLNQQNFWDLKANWKIPSLDFRSSPKHV